MTSSMNLMHEQEVRRQAMLQAMQLDVWLPRQQLTHAAVSRDYLLDWQTETAAAELPAVPASTTQGLTKPALPRAETPSSATDGRGRAYVSVRDKLAALQSTQPAAAAAKTSVEVSVVESVPAVIEPLAVQAEPIPRFALQLLRADNCLVLVDLPTGEPFQSRDPDYQLLKDMLRAAGLTDKPSLMRQGAPITWPMLHSGNLMHEQNAAAARACVRDLLSFELQNAPAVCVWLIGQAAVRFGSQDDNTELYRLQPFVENTQLWSLPSLESVLQQPLLKRDIWQSMCALASLWQVQNDA